MKAFVYILASLLFATMVSADEKCCEECTIEGEIKYYSIDKTFDRCGECCMNPDKYWIYHIFEPGLTEATVDNPCYENGYTEYEKTETHGAMGITMTLDKYKKP